MNNSLTLNATPSTSVESTTIRIVNITARIQESPKNGTENFEIPRIFNIFGKF